MLTLLIIPLENVYQWWSLVEQMTREMLFLQFIMKMYRGKLTVGLLVASTGSRSTELLGLAATWVSNQQGPVVLDQDVLDLFLGSLVDIFKREKNIEV